MPSSEREAEIKSTLAALEKAWRRYPYLRLCQLIVNVTDRDDPFYVEDVDLLKALPNYQIGES